jgi:unsaturated rhamnogalacturonyl hydrolase
MWDDTLMMSVIPLTKIGLLMNRPQYVTEATYQMLLHVQYLFDAPTGLWFHGWEFDGTGGGHNFAQALWARGNCWITVSIPLFLEMMNYQKTDPVYLFLVSTYKRQVDALVKLQNPENGMWHTLLVDPTSYVETSATAGFAAGIYMGIRLVSTDGLALELANLRRVC